MADTLRGRLALTYSVLTIVLVAVLGVAILSMIRNFYVDQLADQLADEARMAGAAAAPTLAANGSQAEIDALVKRLGAQFDGRLTIVGSDGQVLGDSRADPATMANQSALPEVVAALSGGTGGVGTTRGSRSLAVAVTLAEANRAPVVVRISVQLDNVNAALQRVRRDVFGFAMIAAAIAAAVAIFVSARITRPIDALRRHAAEVSGGNLSVSTPPYPPRETAELARSFNSMTARLRELVLDEARSRSRLQAIFTNLTDGVVMVDERGAILGLNDAASDILMTNPIWAVGHPFMIAARDHDLVRLMEQSFAGEGAKTATIEYTRGGRVIEATAQLVTGTDERFGILVLRDISALRRLESIRREFVANVSHELRTPLASIRAVVETLEAGAIDDPEVAGDFLGRIVGEVDRLATLVDELLDLARLESGRLSLKLEQMSSADLIRRGAERLRPQTERANLALEIEIDPDLPEVTVDRTRIEQVLINLIHNAIKFTPSGGTITVRAHEQHDSLEVTVSDTGIGIPESEVSRVFERFYKADRARRSEGTGLGLAIAKHIVHAHGGSISAESQTTGPRRGTTFTFSLPFHPPEHGPYAASQEVLRMS